MSKAYRDLMQVRSERTMRHRGFTLIELFVVLTLMAIVAAAVLLNYQGRYRSAGLEYAIERFTMAERQLRSHARKVNRPAELWIDLGSGRIERRDLVKKEPIAAAIRLPGRVRIDRVVTPENQAHGAVVRSYVSRHGHTTTYAVHFAGSGQRSAWLLIAGITGQVTRLDGERDVAEIFRMLSAPGVYPD